MKKTVVMFPGQGIQKKGMGGRLFDNYSELIAKADEIVGFSLKELCLYDPDRLLDNTYYSQLAIYVTNALYYFEKINDGKIFPDFFIGHSLGEINALLCAGVFDFITGLKLVKKRGELMAKSQGGGMAAVLGLTRSEMENYLQTANLNKNIVIANYNTETQLVLSGEKNLLEKQLKCLKKECPLIKFLLLKTSGAFHSHFMQEASDAYRLFLEEFNFNTPKFPVLSNANLDIYNKNNVIDNLALHLVKPVDWEKTIFSLIEMNVGNFIEIGEASLLTNMVNKIQDWHRKNIMEKNRSINYLDDDIVVIGMACKFPDAETTEEFWDNLEKAKTSFKLINNDRFDTKPLYQKEVTNKIISQWHAPIDNAGGFDNDFFNISAKDAENMDPQQRILLQEVWHCIEDAGIQLKFLQEAVTSVYIGVMASDYLLHVIKNQQTIDAKLGINNYSCGLANRISHLYNFHGSSLSCDTACAASITGLSLAMQSIKSHESDFAVVGGVNILAHEMRYVDFSKSRMLSPSGIVKTFDTDADGYVQGDGIGVVLLTTLKNAKKLNCRIHGVLKSAVVQHMGSSKNITAPSLVAQKKTIQAALKQANLSEKDISYVETHGTGTVIGDPIEIHALKEVFGDTHPLYIGAVKANIGHLEAAAGMAGLIKVLLMLKHKKIPPSCSVKKENILLDLANTKISISKNLRDWDFQTKAGRCAGVSSFGFGGVNAHCILQEYVEQPTEKNTDDSFKYPFLISAKSEVSFRKLVEIWLRKIESGLYNTFSIKDICFSNLKGREALSYRAAFYVKDLADLREKLSKVQLEKIGSKPKQIIFIISGASESGKIDGAKKTKELFYKIIDSGIYPSKIVGIDKGYETSFYCNNSIDEEEFLLLNNNEKIVINNGDWPIFVDSKESIFDKKISGSCILECLHEALAEPVDLAYYQDTYQDLFSTRSDFSETVSYWLKILPIPENGEWTPFQKLIFFLAVKLGVNRIYQRYGIQKVFGHSSALDKLIIFINKGQLDQEKLFNHLQYFVGSLAKPLDEAKLFTISNNDRLNQKNLKSLLKNDDIVIHIGSLAIDLDGPHFFNFDEDAQRFIDNMVGLWKLGQNINWLDLIPKNMSNQINLPLYPFNEKSYWVKDKNDYKKTQNYTKEKVENIFIQGREYGINLIKKAINTPDINPQNLLSDLGIDSIVIYQLYDQMSEKFGKFPISYFFESDTLNNFFDKLSGWIAENSEENISTIINKNNEKVVVSEKSRIVITGASGRYPQAKNLNEFWENLLKGQNSITAIPENRWNVTLKEPIRVLNKTLSDPLSGGFINDIEYFDAGLFGISPNEAVTMDPQERLVLELAWECFESAGYSQKCIEKLQSQGNLFGVFVGASYNNYQLIVNSEGSLPVSSQAYAIANRVSYHFNLKGPSVVVDTACSSSLYAFHLACQSLLSGECDYALVGGVNLSLHPSKYEMLAKLGFLSTDGRCRAFGDGGDGYVPAEGVGAILITREDLAKSNFHNILAYVGATAASHGGKANGFTVPNSQSQSYCVNRAIEKAGWDAREISYIEAHGTGTKLGDPIEIQSLQSAFSNYTRDRNFCAIGSVKSNIGHTEAAAGIAQISKVLLQFQYKKIVPTLLHSQKVNPFIDFSQSPFYLPLEEAQDWQPYVIDSIKIPRRAGISSFGAGGLNVHVLLEEGPENHQENISNNTHIFIFSARDFSQLQKYVKILIEFFENGLEVFSARLAELAYTLQFGRDALKCRLSIVANDLKELMKQMECWLTNPSQVNEGVYQNTTSYEGDDTDRELIEFLIQKNHINKIAKLWTAGFSVPWEFWHQEKPENFSMLSFPVRPLLRQRYWPYENFLPDSELVSKNKKVLENEPSISLNSVAMNVNKFITIEEISRKLISIASTILGYPQESIKEDHGFFELGMESLTAMQFLDKLRGTFFIEISDTDIFSYQTPELLSSYIYKKLSEVNKENNDGLDSTKNLGMQNEEELIIALKNVVGDL